MQPIEIPLTPDNQYFQVSLGDVNYTLKVVWRNTAGWIMDIIDSNGETLLAGVPLVPGLNLLGQYPHLGISGVLAVVCDTGNPEYPTETNLGSFSHLIYSQE